MPEPQSLQLTDLRPGFQFAHYQLLEQLSYGFEGFVWSAIDQSRNQIVAIKFSEATDKEIESELQFKRHAERLTRLVHRHILPLYEFGFITPIRYLVSPYLPGGSLEDRLLAAKIPVEEVLDHCAKIASTLDYLHSQGIIHRDIKPSNILMDYSNQPYLGDFGIARNIVDTTRAFHTGRGTPPYSSPESFNRREITAKSDIFSFGVMIYEVFTGELPWDGDKTLGLEQLYSKEEIPDPQEKNAALPGDIWNILRRVTSLNPDNRPASAGEVIRLVFNAFGYPLPLIDQTTTQAFDLHLDLASAQNRGLLGSDATGGAPRLGLTKFALLDLQQRQAGREVPSDVDIAGLMLKMALFYGYNDAYWWKQVADPKERLMIASQSMDTENKVLVERTVSHLVEDRQIHGLRGKLPEKTLLAMFDLARRDKIPGMRQKIFDTVRALTPPSQTWRANALGEEPDKYLAALALENPPMGSEAARLIGNLHSQISLDLITSQPESERRNAALLEIREAAGSLSSTVAQSKRIEVAAASMGRRLFAGPGNLLAVFALVALGVALGGGILTYLTVRMSGFFDLLRVNMSLERGLILGILLGFGIFVTRVIVERFPESRPAWRVALGTLVGGILLTLGMSIYDALWNETSPQGILIAAGCLLIALGYALSGLVRYRLVRIPITALAVLLALAGTWWGYTAVHMTPLFFFEPTWSIGRILGTMLCMAIPMAIFGNLGKLSLKPG